MIVTRANFHDVLHQLEIYAGPLAIDTETTGLRPYHGDEFFSIILSDGAGAWYFNFNHYDEITENENLEDPVYRESLRGFFARPRVWYGHNLKFDLAMLARAGFETFGTFHDTMALARVLDNDLFPNQFSLDFQASTVGEKKIDTVKEWVIRARAFKEVDVPGKKTKKKNLLYTLVPWDLIVPYGEADGRITYRLAQHQLRELARLADEMTAAGVGAHVGTVLDNERRLAKTVFDMERRGVAVDRPYCEAAVLDCNSRLARAAAVFEAAAGLPYVDSAKTFREAFASEEERWVYGELTATGKKNPSFDSEVLASFESPAARAVLDYRAAKSDVDFYQGFLYHADAGGVIHASLNQHGTATGRFSSSEPNLQNLTKDEGAALEAKFVVRRAIVPRAGNVFHMLDYDQMEYRLMLDYAARLAVDGEGVLALIEKVLGGLDVHQATADVATVSRTHAKMVNFAILYGSGIANLASRLAVTEARARDIRDSIFRAAPEIRMLIARVTNVAEKRGWIANWFGRRLAFSDARYAYRAPNHLIQGGCADVVKLAMNRVDDYLQPFRTKLVLMIHDELVLEGPPDEAMVVVPAVRALMEKAYPSTHIPLTCGVDHSFKSLADKKEGIAPWAT